MKSKPDGGRFRRFKSAGTRASRGLRRSIQLWNENEDRESRREQKRGYCQLPQTLCFSEEKMSFSVGEVVFYRWKIRSKAANVAEVDREKCEEGCEDT